MASESERRSRRVMCCLVETARPCSSLARMDETDAEEKDEDSCVDVEGVVVASCRLGRE